LPSGVRGPVDFCALRRFASICLGVTIEHSAFSDQLSAWRRGLRRVSSL
jgi:hypothetical protein